MLEELAQLKSEDLDTRVKAARMLGQVKSAHAVAALIEALDDPAVDVRWTAAYSLSEIGDAQALEPLISALARHLVETTGWDFRVRANIRTALGRINPSWGQLEPAKAMVPALLSALTHDDVNVRSDAAEILAKIIDARAITPLACALVDEELGVRSAAAEALNKIKEWWRTDSARSAVPMLTRGLESSNNGVRVTAQTYLKRIMTGNLT